MKVAMAHVIMRDEQGNTAWADICIPENYSDFTFEQFSQYYLKPAWFAAQDHLEQHKEETHGPKDKSKLPL